MIVIELSTYYIHYLHASVRETVLDKIHDSCSDLHLCFFYKHLHNQEYGFSSTCCLIAFYYPSCLFFRYKHVHKANSLQSIEVLLISDELFRWVKIKPLFYLMVLYLSLSLESHCYLPVISSHGILVHDLKCSC